MKGKPAITPCTPTGILELLDFYKINVIGMDVLIINRSSLVGKPLACLLLERGSTVTVCHSKSKKARGETEQIRNDNKRSWKSRTFYSIWRYG